ncbi:MAG: FAD-dependent oxidoreductase [Geodermatophilaceae bacterium]|nr:FAD-dependent oxidoreductase [Geodermatophilaceae bacterium]
MRESYDVVVVGGGAAGLSAGLALARARRAVLVVDAGSPRNAAAGHVHNYLGREASPPADLLAAGRAEVAGYGGEVVSGTVTSASARDGGGFAVKLADGSAVDARRLLVATGLIDDLPDVPGLHERWGRDVLHCPYCHGWEVRGQALGILGTGPFAVQQAQMFRQWSADVTLFLHSAPPPTEEELEQLAARGITLVEGEVVSVEVRDDRISGVRLRSGEVVPREAVVVAPRFTARADVLATLGLEPIPMTMAGHVFGTYIAAHPTGATAVPGVWVAGNVTDLRATVITAASAGLTVAAALNADLIAEDIRYAVAAHRRAGSELADTFWNDFYERRDRVWSGNPNAVLVREVAELTPGKALDLGCAEGADAIWLAQRGWQVTGVDIAQIALERAAEHAAAAGVTDRIDWQRHDLGLSFPAGNFDLVSAHFLHSYLDLPRDEILRAAAAAVAPGGVLLVVGHAGPPSYDPSPEIDVHLPTPQEVLDALALPAEEWELQRSDEHEHHMTGPDGQPATRINNTLRIQRRSEPSSAMSS